MIGVGFGFNKVRRPFVVESLPSEVWLEAECGNIGAGWTVVNDETRSGGAYVLASIGENYFLEPPSSSDAYITFDFSVSAGVYSLYALINTPDDLNDSFWVKIDDSGQWFKWNNLQNSDGFIWKQLHDSDNSSSLVSFNLSAGLHTLYFSIREDGSAVDKIYITKTGEVPTGLGGQAFNCS